MPRDGERVAADDRQSWIDSYGADAVARCRLCGLDFLRLRQANTECRTCWHDGFVGHFALAYEPVLSALRAAGMSAVMTQTGGMTMAIEFPCPGGGTFLVGDAEDGGLRDPSSEGGQLRRYCLAFFEGDSFDTGGEILGLDLLPDLPPGVRDAVFGLETAGDDHEQVVQMALAGVEAVRRWRELSGA